MRLRRRDRGNSRNKFGPRQPRSGRKVELHVPPAAEDSAAEETPPAIAEAGVAGVITVTGLDQDQPATGAPVSIQPRRDGFQPATASRVKPPPRKPARPFTPDDAATPAADGSPCLTAKPAGPRVKIEPRQVLPRTQLATPPTEADPAVPKLRQPKKKAAPKRSRDVAIERVAGGRRRSTEESWARAKLRTQRRWLVGIPVAIVTMIIVAMIMFQHYRSKHRAGGLSTVPRHDLVVERIEVDDRAGFLSHNPISQLAQATAILRRHVTATSIDDALAEVRDPARVATLIGDWQPWPNPPIWENRLDAIWYALVTERDPPFMVLWGKCQDFSPFRAYFVRQNGRLLLDWEATTGYSEIPIDHLRSAAPTTPVVIRCLIAPRTFHTASLPEATFRSYLIDSPGSREFVWGYAIRGSDLDHRLQDALKSDSAFLEQQSSERVTLAIVSPPKREIDSQFMITELLQTEWVTPTTQPN